MSTWVVVEEDAAGIAELGRELLTLGRAFGDVVAIVIGSGSDAAMEQLAQHGAETVWLADPGARLPAAPVAAALAARAEANPPELVLVGQTYNGRDIAARLAARLGVGVLSNAIRVELKDGSVETEHEVLGGTQIATARTTSRPAIVLIRSNTHLPQTAEIVSSPIVESLALPEQTALDSQVLASHERTVDDIPLQGADIVVAGGLGIGSPDGYQVVDRLGRLLGAATGATRAVVDAGWVPYAKQIGQTGQTVKPKFYIACGISGAIQHTVGMKDSNTIVAINTNPEAPIFSFADLGIVGDVHSVLPKLIEELEKRA